MKRIRDILTRHKTPVSVDDDVTYKQVTIRTNYKGVVLRGTQRGATIGTKNQWRVSAGQFILSRIDARNGAFGIIPEDLEGAIVTNDFLAFDINEDEVEREFFNVFLQSPIFLDACIKASRGNTNRKRVDETFFLNYEVNLPPLAEQHDLIKRINKGRTSVGIAHHEIAHQQTLLGKLKQAILQEAIQGKLTADLPVRQAGWRDNSFINLSGKKVLEQSDGYFAYVLECSDQSLYKGMCQNLWERIDRHLAGQGSEWTAKHKPVALIHFDEFDTQEEARERECYFKSGSGREFLKLLHQERRETYEPASQLLKRIQAEKARLADLPAGKAGKKLRPARRAGGKENPLPKITPEEIPFEIPEGWEWCRPVDVCATIVDCPHSTPTFVLDGKPCIDSTCIDFQGRIHLNLVRKVDNDTFEDRNHRLVPEKGDIIYVREGLIGQAVIIPKDMRVCLGQRVMLYRPAKLTHGAWLRHVVTSKFFLAEVLHRHKGMGAKHINMSDLRSMPIPLPPLAEQAAIVERVEALMTTCRALEAEIEQSRTHATHLLQAVLKEAFAPATTKG